MQLLMFNEDKSDAECFATQLISVGFTVEWHISLSLALDSGRIDSATAILLVDDPNGSTLSTRVRSIRRAGLKSPLLVLAKSADWRAKVNCLDEGADDVILKPVRIEEICARLRAIVRRSAGRPNDRIQIGPIDLDLKARCAWHKGVCLGLTQGEFRLLRLLMLNPDRTVSLKQILDQLARHDTRPSKNAAEVQVARLRRKLDKGRILTIRNLGYRFVAGKMPSAVAEREPCRAALGQPCNCPFCERLKGRGSP